MKNNWCKKGLVVGIIVLLIGVGVQSAFAVDIPEKEEIEPKDYLFETIIKINKNPEVKELFEEYGYNTINFDFDNKYIFRQLFFKNPELFFSMLFTNPKMTIEELNFAYNQGCDIVNIIGEDKTLKMIKSVEISNPEFFDELNYIIMDDEELSNRILTLAELNEVNSAICDILFILFLARAIKYLLVDAFSYSLEDYPLLYSFIEIRLILLEIRMFFPIALMFEFGCIEIP